MSAGAVSLVLLGGLVTFMVLATDDGPGPDCTPVVSFPAGADYAHGVWTVNGVTYAYSSSEDSLAYRYLSCL